MHTLQFINTSTLQLRVKSEIWEKIILNLESFSIEITTVTFWGIELRFNVLDLENMIVLLRLYSLKIHIEDNYNFILECMEISSTVVSTLLL